MCFSLVTTKATCNLRIFLCDLRNTEYRHPLLEFRIFWSRWFCLPHIRTCIPGTSCKAIHKPVRAIQASLLIVSHTDSLQKWWVSTKYLILDLTTASCCFRVLAIIYTRYRAINNTGRWVWVGVGGRVSVGGGWVLYNGRHMNTYSCTNIPSSRVHTKAIWAWRAVRYWGVPKLYLGMPYSEVLLTCV